MTPAAEPVDTGRGLVLACCEACASGSAGAAAAGIVGVGILIRALSGELAVAEEVREREVLGWAVGLSVLPLGVIEADELSRLRAPSWLVAASVEAGLFMGWLMFVDR